MNQNTQTIMVVCFFILGDKLYTRKVPKEEHGEKNG
jgi:hypothetical protein